MGVATGCGFKEIYRFPHTTYPYSSCIYLYFFAAASLLFCSFFIIIRTIIINDNNIVKQWYNYRTIMTKVMNTMYD